MPDRSEQLVDEELSLAVKERNSLAETIRTSIKRREELVTAIDALLAERSELSFVREIRGLTSTDTLGVTGANAPVVMGHPVRDVDAANAKLAGA